MDQLNFRPLEIGDAGKVTELFLQLTCGPSDVNFEDLVADPKCHCVVAVINNEVVGFGALVRHTVPCKGEVGRIEDVVIDEKYHGKGYGRAIMKELIAIANEENVLQINLTSNSQRIAAISLYGSLGFARIDTNVFNLKLR